MTILSKIAAALQKQKSDSLAEVRRKNAEIKRRFIREVKNEHHGRDVDLEAVESYLKTVYNPEATLAEERSRYADSIRLAELSQEVETKEKSLKKMTSEARELELSIRGEIAHGADTGVLAKERILAQSRIENERSTATLTEEGNSLYRKAVRDCEDAADRAALLRQEARRLSSEIDAIKSQIDSIPSHADSKL